MLFVSLTAVAALASSVHAWGTLSHATIADIAWMTAKPSTVQYLVSAGLLNQYNSTLITNSANATNNMASWADSHRSGAYAFSYNMHFADTDDSPPDSCSFVYERDCPGGVCHVGAIANYTNQLICANGFDLPTRTQALEFVLHFLGDITQPLHNCKRATGGNDIKVAYGE
ncbi:hypothetical protein HK101_007475 [Irineochytrium annulatum]|nr:hypothetical protein HK101_007475 [Irineochytrium annulatum]